MNINELKKLRKHRGLCFINGWYGNHRYKKGWHYLNNVSYDTGFKEEDVKNFTLM